MYTAMMGSHRLDTIRVVVPDVIHDEIRPRKLYDSHMVFGN